jgi:copper homeostasis protein (lipoprotein)
MKVLYVIAAAAITMSGLAVCGQETGVLHPEDEAELPADRTNAWGDISTFRGRLPCASCAGIDVVLQLNPDGTFLREDTYLEAESGDDGESVDLGRWALTLDEQMLILIRATEGGNRWSVVGADTLRQLTNLGASIESDLPYELVRTDSNTMSSRTLKLSGMYQYMADAALFEECRTRSRYPVVFEEAHIDLERAYLAASEQPGVPMMTVVEARIESRPRMEGSGERDFIVVSKFVSVSPDKSCYGETLPVEETVWSLTELNGKPLEASDETQVPHIVLIEEEHQVAGSGGCNRFSGSYRLSADSLRFGPTAATMMQCQNGMEQEASFLQAISATTNFDHYGPMLELWATGRLLARFEAIRLERPQDKGE